ncbi:hypothetical protein MRS44_006815 [Fusarium solani]|uniref:uncharacterized protein n=1 Tax=Fusarium solani TaxID=169388 RepID=UPI0032C49410|nr:hypothetical protein MRS44_006815 [Fusarium solani]
MATGDDLISPHKEYPPVAALHLHLEDESLLELPGRKVDNLDQFEADVFIIGGGNAAVALAARLKDFGVESFICEQNARVGDNWALRYDNLRFHLPTSIYELPYMSSQWTTYSSLEAPGASHWGSGNSAFDIVSDCHAAGLQTTMVARSLTYILPLEYVCHDASFGVYDHGVEAADRLFMTLPTMILGQLTQGLLQKFASEEPDRYVPLAAAGFPVINSTDPSQLVLSNLIERSHSHYIDLGDTELIVDKKVGTKAEVEPNVFATTGLHLSDDSILEADAIVWCTGFADQDVRTVTEEILGGHGMSTVPEDHDEDKNLLGPRDIASRLDAT